MPTDVRLEETIPLAREVPPKPEPNTVGVPNSIAVPPLLTRRDCPALPIHNEAPSPPTDKPMVSPD